MAIQYVPHEDAKTRWPAFVDPALPAIPGSRAELYRVFGDPRLRGPDGQPVGRADPAWVKRSIVELHGERALPGIPPRFYYQTHRLAIARTTEALRRAAIVCPEYRVVSAASFVYRHIRHDTPELAAREKRPLRELSIHAVAAALDINPEQNRGIEFKRRQDIPDFFSPAWRKLWPAGMPREFVDAFLSVGFTWGGNWDSDDDAQDQHFVDGMHMQLATCG